jgi:hypothetical protein
MFFAQDGNIEKALKDSIEASVKDRISKMCET